MLSFSIYIISTVGISCGTITEQRYAHTHTQCIHIVAGIGGKGKEIRNYNSQLHHLNIVEHIALSLSVLVDE